MENEGGDYNYTTNGDGEIEEVAVAAAPPGSIHPSRQSTTGGYHEPSSVGRKRWRKRIQRIRNAGKY